MQPALALTGPSAPPQLSFCPAPTEAGVWHLHLGDAGLPAGSAPSPLQVAADVRRALKALPSRPREVVLGADRDPLTRGPAWSEAALQAALQVVDQGLTLRLSTRGAPGRQPGTEGWATLLSRAAGRGGATLEVRLGSMEAGLAALYERGAPAPEVRLAAAAALAQAGVRIHARVDPLVPWVADTTARLEPLVRSLAAASVRQVQVSYVQATPAGLRRLRHLPAAHRALLQGCFLGEPGEGPRRLPREIRQRGLERLVRLGRAAGLSVSAAPDTDPDLSPQPPPSPAALSAVAPRGPRSPGLARHRPRPAMREGHPRPALQAGKVVSLAAARARWQDGQLPLFA